MGAHHLHPDKEHRLAEYIRGELAAGHHNCARAHAAFEAAFGWTVSKPTFYRRWRDAVEAGAGAGVKSVDAGPPVRAAPQLVGVVAIDPQRVETLRAAAAPAVLHREFTGPSGSFSATSRDGGISWQMEITAKVPTRVMREWAHRMEIQVMEPA